MFQFLYYKHINTITKITIYMHSSQYYGSHRNVGTIKRFVHICHMAPKVYNSNFKEQSTCDSNSRRGLTWVSICQHNSQKV